MLRRALDLERHLGGSANSGAPFKGPYGVYAEMIGIRVKVSESWQPFELLICGDARIWVHICYGSYVRESLFEGMLMCQQQCRVRALCTNDRAELSSVFKRKIHSMH